MLIYLICVLVIFAFYIIGALCYQFFNLKKMGLTFFVPLGMIIFFAITEIIYLPILLLNLNSNIIHYSFILLILIIYALGLFYRQMLFGKKANFKKNKSQIILGFIFFVLMLAVYRYTEVKLRTDDANFYIPYIYGLAYSDTFYSTISSSSYLYIYQSFFNFLSTLIFIYHKFSFLPIYEYVMPLGLIINFGALLFFFTFSFSLIDIFNVLKKYIKFNLQKKILFFVSVILILSFYWFIAHPYYGNTFRRITIMYLFYFIHNLFTDRNNKSFLLFSLGITSLFSQSSTGFFLGAMLAYALLVIMIFNKLSHYIIKYCVAISPLALFMVLIREYLFLFVIIGYSFILLIKIFKKDDLFEKVLYKLRYLILVGVPLFFISHALVNNYLDITMITSSHYFDMVNQYMLFDFSSVTTAIYTCYNIFSWITLLFNLKYISEDSMKGNFSKIILIILITFFNPLVCSFVSKYITDIVYFRIYDLIFNPLTIIFCLFMFINEFKNKSVNSLLILCSIIIMILQISISDLKKYYNSKIDPIYHVEKKEMDVYHLFRKYTYSSSDKIVVASHVYGTKMLVDFPIENVVLERIDSIEALFEKNDEESLFQQIFYRKKYDDPRYEVNYLKACQLAEDRRVQYTIVDKQYNYYLEEGIGYCGEVLFEYENYRIYIMRYDWDYPKY